MRGRVAVVTAAGVLAVLCGVDSLLYSKKESEKELAWDSYKRIGFARSGSAASRIIVNT